MASNAGSKVPSSYEEMYVEYWDYVRALVRKHGIQNDEDAASDIMLKFMEKDFLAKFDEDFTKDVDGATKKTSFQGFLSGFVGKYVLQHRDRQATRYRKETEWPEIYDPWNFDPTPSTDTAIALERATANITARPIRGKRDLGLVLRMSREQIETTGRIDRKAIGDELGVSQTAMCLIFQDLRDALVEEGVGPADFTR